MDVVLEHGEGLDINGIADLEARKQRAIDEVQEGVHTFVVGQTLEIEDVQHNLQFSLDNSQELIEDAIRQLLGDLMTDLDSTVDGLIGALNTRDNGAF